MRKRVHLHGPYAAFHDGPIEVEASTAWDAVEAVVTQLPGFKPSPITGKKIIQVVGFDTLESLKSETDVVDLHVMPHLSFGKNGGLIQTVIGVALLVTAAFMGGVFWPAIVAGVGASMLVGGIMQMLSPQPQLNSNNEDQERSKYLGSVANTVRIGTPIALLYGRYRAGGQILSFNIDSKDTGI